ESLSEDGADDVPHRVAHGAASVACAVDCVHQLFLLAFNPGVALVINPAVTLAFKASLLEQPVCVATTGDIRAPVRRVAKGTGSRHGVELLLFRDHIAQIEDPHEEQNKYREHDDTLH